MQAMDVDGLQWLGHVLDSLVYVFCPLLFCLLLRITQVTSTCWPHEIMNNPPGAA